MESLEEWLTQPEGMATRLRVLRVQAGLSGKQLADTNSWAQSKVSRIENGKQMPSPEDIEAWTETCNADPNITQELLRLRGDAKAAQVTFRERMRHGQQQVQEGYNQLVGNSHLIRHFETVFVPGLLQVPAYAHRVLTEMRGLHGAIDDVDAAVAARMQRQQMLYDPTKSFEFLLAEPVLRWLICSPAVMRSQLDRLQTVIGLDRVRFGILPMGVELATTPQNSFQVYVGEETKVIVETFLNDDPPYMDEQAEHFVRVLDLMWDEAVTGEDARQLIISATRALNDR